MKWSVISSELVGTKNRAKEIGCQNGRVYRTEDGTQVICLVDLEERTEKTASYSIETTKMMAQFLLENQEMIQSSDEATIEYNLKLRMERWMEEKCKTYDVSKQELQASVLALMMNADGNLYCLIHLGGGAAWVWSGDNQLYPLSENSRKKTVHKGRGNKVKGFLLASNGVYGGRHDYEPLKDIFRRRYSHDILENKKEEDQSVILLIRS